MILHLATELLTAVVSIRGALNLLLKMLAQFAQILARDHDGLLRLVCRKRLVSYEFNCFDSILNWVFTVVLRLVFLWLHHRLGDDD